MEKEKMKREKERRGGGEGEEKRAVSRKKRERERERERFQSKYIGTYILLSLPLDIREWSLQGWQGYNRTQLYFIIDGPGDASEPSLVLNGQPIRRYELLPSVDVAPTGFSLLHLHLAGRTASESRLLPLPLKGATQQRLSGFPSDRLSPLLNPTALAYGRAAGMRERELVLIQLCYAGISSFAGDLINSVIWLEEAPKFHLRYECRGIVFENTCCA